MKKQKITVPAEVKKLLTERDKARADKDWSASDKLRDKINKLGFAIKDTSEGSVVEAM